MPELQPPPPDTADIGAVRVVSPEQLKTWSRCKAKFNYQHVLQLAWPTDTSNFKLGQEVHKLMDYQAQGLTAYLPAMLASADAPVVFCWEGLMADPVASWPVIRSEWAFWIPMKHGDSHWLLGGRIDRISRDPASNQVVIIDWKTGTATPRLPEQDWQTRVYCYAVYEARAELGLPDITPEDIAFLYVEINPRQPERGIRQVRVPYSRTRHEANRLSILAQLDAMDRETEYPLPETCPDRHCPYRPVCGIDENPI
ncbi:MAG: PD-(D/E)XK nuclease family protein [Candidatus Melainabacteria bacterium]